jgi:hypothetical protein
MNQGFTGHFCAKHPTPPVFAFRLTHLGGADRIFISCNRLWVDLVRVIGIAQVSSGNEALSPRFCGKL